MEMRPITIALFDVLGSSDRMATRPQANPEFNLDSLLNFWYMDYYTNPANAIGGLLCKLAEDKGGQPMLRRLMSFGKDDNDFYKAIEAVFGVKQPNLGRFIRTNVTEYSTE